MNNLETAFIHFWVNQVSPSDHEPVRIFRKIRLRVRGSLYDLMYKSSAACIPLSSSHDDAGTWLARRGRDAGADDENLTGAAAAAPLIATNIKPSIRSHFARLFELFFELAEWRGAWMIVNKGVSSVLIRAERQASFPEHRGSE